MAPSQSPRPPTLHPANFFSEQKEKRETEGKKERVSNEKLSKRRFTHSRASRIQKSFLPANHGSRGRQYFSVFLDPSTLSSISLGLIECMLFFNV